MDSEKLNKAIMEICDDEQYTVKGISEHGKCIPYIGWYWRDVNFNEKIWLGDCGKFAGFMENNKWGYPYKVCSKTDSRKIVELLQKATKTPSNKSLQQVFDFIQRAYKRAEKKAGENHG